MKSIGACSTGLPSHKVAIQANTCMPIGIAIADAGSRENEAQRQQREPGREHVMDPKTKAEESNRDGRQPPTCTRRVGVRAKVGSIIETMPAAGRKMM